MVEEYCHVKTTPDMPIRLAVRMSMSIPGELTPCIVEQQRVKIFFLKFLEI